MLRLHPQDWNKGKRMGLSPLTTSETRPSRAVTQTPEKWTFLWRSQGETPQELGLRFLRGGATSLVLVISELEMIRMVLECGRKGMSTTKPNAAVAVLT